MLLTVLGALTLHPSLQAAPSETGAPIIEAIECKGLVALDCEFIRRKLALPEYATSDSEEVRNAQLRLSALPNFESVQVSLEKGAQPGRVRLVVDVVEADSFLTEVSAFGQYQRWDGDLQARNAVLTGRVSHQNFLGRQKILEVSLLRSVSSSDWRGVSSSEGDGWSGSLVYIDPNVLGAPRVFGSISVGYSDGEHKLTWRPYAPAGALVRIRYESQLSEAAASVGYRLWDFSYVVAGFTHSSSEVTQTSHSTPTTLFDGEEQFESDINSWRLLYGWDSEDDAYFPTRGSRLSAMVLTSDCDDCFPSDDVDWRAAYKHTWMTGGRSVWSVNVGGEPESAGDRLRPLGESDSVLTTGGLSVTYARLLTPSDGWGGLRRGRWYVELGAGPFELQRHGEIFEDRRELTMEIGLRFESKTFGLVHLFAKATASES